VDGHFDDYMQWLATTWKKQEEAAKKAGLITKYQVLVAQPQGPNDPDIYLVVEYKNWAAFDGLGGKLDAVSAQVEGSVEKVLLDVSNSQWLWPTPAFVWFRRARSRLQNLAFPTSRLVIVIDWPSSRSKPQRSSQWANAPARSGTQARFTRRH
jgi:hypothetical protein